MKIIYFIILMYLIGCSSSQDMESYSQGSTGKAAPEFLPYMEKWRKEFRWRQSMTEAEFKRFQKMNYAPEEIENIKKNVLGKNPFATFKNYFIIQKFAGFEIDRKNYAGAVKIWEEYRKFFPNKSDDISEIIKSLKAPEGNITVTDVGEAVNSGSAYNPSPELSGKRLFFTANSAKDGKGGEDVFYAEYADGKWGKRTAISSLNTSGHEAVLGISPDGNELMIFGNYPGSLGKGDIFYSLLTEDGWSSPQSYGPPVNSPYFESDAFKTADGQAILFSSDRPNEYSDTVMKGTYYNASYWGNTDLYISFRQQDGTYSRPKNLGPMINSPGAERTPFMHPDGKTLYFSSDGYSGFGGLDLYKSVRLDDTWTKWSKPVHLGKTLNTTSDDWGFQLTASSDKGFIAGISSKGGNSIYVITPLPPAAKPDNQVAAISGTVTDENGEPIAVDIEWEDRITGTSLGKLQSRPNTGEFFITLPLGTEYGYYARKRGYLNESQTVDLRKVKSYTESKINIRLFSVRAAREKGVEITINNVSFGPDSDRLETSSYPELKRLAGILSSEKSLKLEVQGHTSTGKSEEFNVDLSSRRAASVVKYLTELGIDRERLVSRGYGSSKPAASNTDEAGRQKNRRVSFRILSEINN
ncbi:MAG TPA: OmpA family protein [Leptospiraceae bacterium]|nr:OmpA family protein [Leptospiraceae bacterium]